MKPRPRGHNLLLDPSTTSMLYFQRKWDEETSNDSYYYYLIMIRKNYIVFESVGKAKRSKFIFKNQGDCIWRLVYQPSIYDLTQFVSYQCARSFLLFTHLHLSHGIVCMYERRCDLPGFPLHCQCMDGPPIPHNTIFKLNLSHAPPLFLFLSLVKPQCNICTFGSVGIASRHRHPSEDVCACIILLCVRYWKVLPRSSLGPSSTKCSIIRRRRRHRRRRCGLAGIALSRKWMCLNEKNEKQLNNPIR